MTPASALFDDPSMLGPDLLGRRAARIVRTRVATIDWLALGALVRRFLMKWVRHLCHDAPGNTAAIAWRSPSWESLITSWISRQASGDEAAEEGSQPAPSPEVIRSRPSTSRLPLAVHAGGDHKHDDHKHDVDDPPGSAPSPALGQSERHPLNPGGDRQANGIITAVAPSPLELIN